MVRIENKRAKRDFVILKEFEAGIELFGFEVKSIRQGRAQLNGAYVIVRGGEAFVVGMSVPPYQPNNTPQEYDPERPRRLLLHKKEILELADAEGKKGLTVVAIALYNKGSYLKLLVGIARGKKQVDKREEIKRRDVERELRRSLKIR